MADPFPVSIRPRAVLRANSLRPLLGIMAASSLSPERVLRAAALPVDLFDAGDDVPVALADYFRLCEQMALQGDDESCHVSLRPLMAGTSDLVQARLLGARTMSDMLDVLANSYNVIHGSRYNRVARRRHSTAYEIDDTDFPYALGHDEPFVILSLECLLVYVHALLLSAVPDKGMVHLRQLTTRGRNDAAAGTHLRFWGVPVRHEAPLFSLVYDGDLDAIRVDPRSSPVITARTIYGGVADMLDRLQPPERTAGLGDHVERLVMQRHHDQGDVARMLGMSVASLRRALHEEGTSFREIRAVTLNRLARQALDEGRPVGDVAELLDFSDGRSFARAFRLWNGVSPGEYARTGAQPRDTLSEIVP